MPENLSKNAGEWSEFYVLLDVLSEGKLYAADGNLNKLDETYFPVISIEMQQEGNSNLSVKYVVDSASQQITITSNNVTEAVSMEALKREARTFFNIISSRRGRSFEVPEISNLLSRLKNPETKQSSNKKADIHIVIHDFMTGSENEVGFSIKSKHSSPATLVNASGQTLFQYIVEKSEDNSSANREDIKIALEPKSFGYGVARKVGPKERVKKLVDAGYKLKFKTIKSTHFKENVQIIDSALDIFLADCLVVFMQSRLTSLSDVVNKVAVRNPCGFVATPERVFDYYKYKMKRFIVDAALGMQPKFPWTGTYDASGGYIVVKETGDVVCYHIYNWNALQDYLYNNLRFETPTSTGSGSKRSFNYALYYSDADEHYMDICLQVRFK